MISACLDIAIELFGADDPRVKEVTKFRNLKHPSEKVYAAKGFLKDIRRKIESGKFSQTSEVAKAIMLPVEIFFSYAHEDEALMDDVRRQLILMIGREL